MRSVCLSALCLGLVFPTISLRVTPVVQNTRVVLPSGVLEEARTVLQRGCGSDCIKEVSSQPVIRVASRSAFVQVLDTFVVQHHPENSSAMVLACTK